MEDYDHHYCDHNGEYYTLRAKYHRLNGPAIIYPDGEGWYCKGALHRLDGPAVIGATGYRAWYEHFKRHRLDGPAMIASDGEMRLWVNDQEYDILEVKNGVHIRSSIVEDIEKLCPSLRTLADYLFQISHEDMCLLRLTPYSIVSV